MTHPTTYTPVARAVEEQDRLLLVGDLGSTTATLAVISPDIGPRMSLVEASFPTKPYPSFAAIVKEFLTRFDLPVHHACFDVPGPVVDGRATLSTLPWLVDEEVLASVLHLTSVRILNDVEALAFAVPHLEPADSLLLNPGIPVTHGALAVVAPGTGLGEAFLVWTGSGYHACPSEGGHADFAPLDDLQIELLQHMRSRSDHLSYESICSASGIQQIYEFLGQKGQYHADGPELTVGMARGDDPAPLVIDAALHAVDSSATSIATINLFLSILGAEAGNMALSVLATGGVYLGGGILPQMQPLINAGRFMRAFQHKGRAAGLLGRMPVHVVINGRASLLGAAYCGLELQLAG
jgi:glucokinase